MFHFESLDFSRCLLHDQGMLQMAMEWSFWFDLLKSGKDSSFSWLRKAWVQGALAQEVGVLVYPLLILPRPAHPSALPVDQQKHHTTQMGSGMLFGVLDFEMD